MSNSNENRFERILKQIIEESGHDYALKLLAYIHAMLLGFVEELGVEKDMWSDVVTRILEVITSELNSPEIMEFCNGQKANQFLIKFVRYYVTGFNEGINGIHTDETRKSINALRKNLSQKELNIINAEYDGRRNPVTFRAYKSVNVLICRIVCLLKHNIKYSLLHQGVAAIGSNCELFMDTVRNVVTAFIRSNFNCVVICFYTQFVRMKALKNKHYAKKLEMSFALSDDNIMSYSTEHLHPVAFRHLKRSISNCHEAMSKHIFCEANRRMKAMHRSPPKGVEGAKDTDDDVSFPCLSIPSKDVTDMGVTVEKPIRQTFMTLRFEILPSDNDDVEFSETHQKVAGKDEQSDAEQQSDDEADDIPNPYGEGGESWDDDEIKWL